MNILVSVDALTKKEKKKFIVLDQYIILSIYFLAIQRFNKQTLAQRQSSYIGVELHASHFITFHPVVRAVSRHKGLRSGLKSHDNMMITSKVELVKSSTPNRQTLYRDDAKMLISGFYNNLIGCGHKCTLHSRLSASLLMAPLIFNVI